MKIGKIWGIAIYLNPFFIALLGLFFIAGILDKGLIAFVTVLIHELAHAIVSRKLGVAVSEVELLPFGGVARVSEDMAVNPRNEVLIAIAGPLVNVILFLASFGFKKYGLWHDVLSPFFQQTNMMIAAFNVLPALPLDGGRVYRAWLAGKMGFRRATYRTSCLGQVFAVLIVAVGSAGLILGWAGLDIIITGLFLFYAATRERASTPYLHIRHLLQKKEDLARQKVLPGSVLVVAENATLGEIMRLFLPGKFHLVLVFDKQINIKAILPEDRLIDCLFEFGLDYPVGKV